MSAAISTFRPSLTGFTVPMIAGLGAIFGFLWGLSMGNGLVGLIAGGALAAVIAYVLASSMENRGLGVLAASVLIGVIGLFLGGAGGAVAGAAMGAITGNATYWLSTGRYRAVLPPYASSKQVLWHHFFRIGICGAIFFFLIVPILIIIPLSFNAENFFTFTKAMLALQPEGYSTKHYSDFLTNPDWQQALRNSFMIAPAATLLATAFGTLAAIGLSQSHVPFRRAIMVVLISPMIVPLIISAAGMYFFYSRIGLQGTYWGVVLAHAALGTPFVIITVTATLVGFDRSLTRAAANMGANPVTTFFKVQMPLIVPGVVSGALFAFITSFDEVVVVLFLGSAAQKTLPWQMFTGLREQISPTILAVATIMVAISIALLSVLEYLRRRSERLRGLTPG